MLNYLNRTIRISMVTLRHDIDDFSRRSTKGEIICCMALGCQICSATSFPRLSSERILTL